MSLTKDDILTIRSLLKEQKGEITQALKSAIKQNTDILKIYMDTRFQQIKETIEDAKHDVLRETDGVLRAHEKRIKSIETELRTTS